MSEQVNTISPKSDSNESPEVTPNQLFSNLVVEFIEKANSLHNSHAPELVSDAFLYAASRFNSFMVARASENSSDYNEERHKALDYFSNRYRAMFKENYDEYLANYEEYLGRK